MRNIVALFVFGFALNAHAEQWSSPSYPDHPHLGQVQKEYYCDVDAYPVAQGPGERILQRLKVKTTGNVKFAADKVQVNGLEVVVTNNFSRIASIELKHLASGFSSYTDGHDLEGGPVATILLDTKAGIKYSVECYIPLTQF